MTNRVIEPIIIALIVLIIAGGSFFLGKNVADSYNLKQSIAMKEALERQYLRLRAYMDADDPCKPYVRVQPIPQQPKSGIPDDMLTQIGKKMNKGERATVTLK